jgi:hypothetical protein
MEMEILSKKELIEQIRENRREKEKGNTITLISWKIWRRNWSYELQTSSIRKNLKGLEKIRKSNEKRHLENSNNHHPISLSTPIYLRVRTFHKAYDQPSKNNRNLPA